MKKNCVLCGGRLRDGICTECGMDNRKSDDMYYDLMNRQECSAENLSHVHTEEGQAQEYAVPVLNKPRKAEKTTGSQQKKQRKQTEKPTEKTVSAARNRQAGSWSQPAGGMLRHHRTSLGVQGGKTLLILLVAGGVLLVNIGRNASQTNENVSVTEVEYDLSDYEPYDWTSVSADGIPETGEVLETDLEAGSYYVGADLPVGIYTISGSTDCSYRVEDWTHWISIQETFGDPSYGIDTAEEVKLFEGAVVYVEGLYPLHFHTENAQTGQMREKTANPLTQSFQLFPNSETLVAGVDFPAGVYDVYAEGDETLGMLCCQLRYEEEGSFSNYIMMGVGDEQYPEYSTSYKNLVLSEGSEISADYGQFTLVPSEKIVTEDYYSYYENFY